MRTSYKLSEGIIEIDWMQQEIWTSDFQIKGNTLISLKGIEYLVDWDHQKLYKIEAKKYDYISA